MTSVLKTLSEECLSSLTLVHTLLWKQQECECELKGYCEAQTRERGEITEKQCDRDSQLQTMLTHDHTGPGQLCKAACVLILLSVKGPTGGQPRSKCLFLIAKAKFATFPCEILHRTALDPRRVLDICGVKPECCQSQMERILSDSSLYQLTAMETARV